MRPGSLFGLSSHSISWLEIIHSMPMPVSMASSSTCSDQAEGLRQQGVGGLEDKKQEEMKGWVFLSVLPAVGGWQLSSLCALGCSQLNVLGLLVLLGGQMPSPQTLLEMIPPLFSLGPTSCR